ncbi:hypothetical protein [Salmonella enterica]|nr:hypothetical protein [Salmonella enterica]
MATTISSLSIAEKGVVREANEAFCRRLHSFVNPFSKFDSNS